MKKLAFATAVIFTTFTFVASDKKEGSNSGFEQTNVTAQTAGLNDEVSQLAPTAMGRANLAQADGKVLY